MIFLSVAIPLIFVSFVLFFPTDAYAYIGPGAGFVVAGSGLVFATSLLMLIATFVLGPAFWLLRWYRGRAARKKARAGRVVIVGLDGLDPKLVDDFKAQGLLPHLSKLEIEGGFRRLRYLIARRHP